MPSCARWTTPASIEQSRNVCRVGCLSAAGCSRDLPKVVDEDLVRFGSALVTRDHEGWRAYPGCASRLDILTRLYIQFE